MPGNEIALGEVFSNVTRFAILENLFSCRFLLWLVTLLAIRNIAVPNSAPPDVPDDTGHICNWVPMVDDELCNAAWDPRSNWADQITSTIVNAFDDVHLHQSPPSSTAWKIIEGTGNSTAMSDATVLKSVIK